MLGNQDFRLGSRDLNGSKEVVELVGTTPDRHRLQRHGLRHGRGQDAEGRAEARAPRPSRRPSPDVHDKTYPLARSLHLYTLGEPEGAVKAYIDWILSDAGQKIVEDERLRAARSRQRARRAEGRPPRHEASSRPPAGDDPGAMSPENAPRSRRRPSPRPERPRWAVLGERALEALIRLSGVSAIIFVLAIFFFVFREAAPVLFERGLLASVQFLFSTEWYPTSATNVRYGTLALTVGTLSVTALAMVLAVPFGLGAAIYLSEFCAPQGARDAQDRHRAALRDPERRLGLHRPHGDEQADRRRCTGAPVGVNVLNGGIILALMSVPIIVSIGEDALKAVPDSYREAARRPRRHPLAARLPGAPPRRAATACWPRCCSASAGRSARRWRC